MKGHSGPGCGCWHWTPRVGSEVWFRGSGLADKPLLRPSGVRCQAVRFRRQWSETLNHCHPMWWITI